MRLIPGLTWTPGIPEVFKHLSMEEFKAKLIPMDLSQVKYQSTKFGPISADLPTEFDSRQKWSDCVGEVRD